MNALPNEILFIIFDFLENKNLFTITLLSKKFNKVVYKVFKKKVGKVDYKQLYKTKITNILFGLKCDLPLYPISNDDLFAIKKIRIINKKVPKEISFLENCEKIEISLYGREYEYKNHISLPQMPPRLKTLHLSNCTIDRCPNSVKVLLLTSDALSKDGNNVETLTLSHWKNDLSILKVFKKLKRLRMTYYANTVFGAQLPENLAKFECCSGHIRYFPGCTIFVQIVDLTDNKIKIFPSNLGSIKQLSLCSNKIKSLPRKIIAKNLEILDLSRNEITKIPSSIAKMKKLKVLNLSHYRIKTISNKISTLEEIYLSKNNLRFIPKAVMKIQSLKKLALDGNRIEIMPEYLFEHKNITEINLSSNYDLVFDKRILTMSSLEILFVENCSISRDDVPRSRNNVLIMI